MAIALTRAVSESLAQCELTHLSREPISIERAREQHAAYEKLLESLGVSVHRVAGAPELPDAVFIEDTAVVTDELAVITRPGAASRRPETIAVAEALGQYRKVVHLEAPATLDGGDVLRTRKTLWVGLSSRTNAVGAAQLGGALAPFGYKVHAMRVEGCLHLKSAVTSVGENLLLVNPAWLPADAFPGIPRIEVDPAEPYAANALRVGDTLIFPAHFPRTLDRLLARGLAVKTVDASELAKAEGAVTCCSILLETGGASPLHTRP